MLKVLTRCVDLYEAAISFICKDGGSMVRMLLHAWYIIIQLVFLQDLKYHHGMVFGVETICWNSEHDVLLMNPMHAEIINKSKLFHKFGFGEGCLCVAYSISFMRVSAIITMSAATHFYLFENLVSYLD